MAKYEHLPIYKTAMDLAVLMEKQVRNMGRYHKYSLGSEFRKRSVEILELVVRANTTSQKIPVLEELRIQLEQLKHKNRVAR